MKIKKNKAYANVLRATTLPEDVFNESFWNAIGIECPEDNTDYYGWPLHSWLRCDHIEANLKPAMDALGVAGWATSDFKSLILMGDGECPECGGRLEFYDASSSTTGDGYITQREPEWIEYRCENCGNIIRR